MRNIKNKMFNKKMQLRNSNGGFTLVELLVYMGLFSIFMVALTEVFTAALSAKIESQATASVDQDGRFIFLRLGHDITRASSINFPDDYGLGVDGLLEESLTILVNGEEYTYALSGGNLTLTTPTATAQLNSNRTIVSNLTFEKVGNAIEKDTVQIRLTLTSTATQNKGPETREFQTTIGMR